MKPIFLYFSILAGLSSCAINKSIHFNDEINYNSYWHGQNELQTPYELEKSLRESMAYETESVYNGIDKKYFFNSQIAKSNFNNEDIDSSYNFIINKLKNFYCDRRFNKVEIALEGPVIIKMTESNGRIDKEISFALDWKESERSFFRLSVTVLNNSKIINSTAMGLFRSSNCYSPLDNDDFTEVLDTIQPFGRIKSRELRRVFLHDYQVFGYQYEILSRKFPILFKRKRHISIYVGTKQMESNTSVFYRRIRSNRIWYKRKNYENSVKGKVESPNSVRSRYKRKFRYNGRYSGKKIK